MQVCKYGLNFLKKWHFKRLILPHPSIFIFGKRRADSSGGWLAKDWVDSKWVQWTRAWKILTRWRSSGGMDSSVVGWPLAPSHLTSEEEVPLLPQPSYDPRLLSRSRDEVSRSEWRHSMCCPCGMCGKWSKVTHINVSRNLGESLNTRNCDNPIEETGRDSR